MTFLDCGPPLRLKAPWCSLILDVFRRALDTVSRARPLPAAAVTLLLPCAIVTAATVASPLPDPASIQIALKREFEQALSRARRGEPGAAYQVGRSYQAGVGIAPDFRLAERWLRRAAALGFVDAVVAQGEAFEFGWGVAPDAERARRHYKWAVEQRSPLGFYALGRLYRSGSGIIKPDASEAFKFFSLAEAHGHYRANDEKQATTKMMSFVSIEYAGYRANAWERLHQSREAEKQPQMSWNQNAKIPVVFPRTRPPVFQLFDLYQIPSR